MSMCQWRTRLRVATVATRHVVVTTLWLWTSGSRWVDADSVIVVVHWRSSESTQLAGIKGDGAHAGPLLKGLQPNCIAPHHTTS